MIPGLGRSPGEGKGYPLQYSGLENFKGYIVHGVAKNQTRLSYFNLLTIRCLLYGLPWWLREASAWNVGDPGRSPGEGNGNPLQYSCVENPMEGGAW